MSHCTGLPSWMCWKWIRKVTRHIFLALNLGSPWLALAYGIAIASQVQSNCQSVSQSVSMWTKPNFSIHWDYIHSDFVSTKCHWGYPVLMDGHGNCASADHYGYVVWNDGWSHRPSRLEQKFMAQQKLTHSEILLILLTLWCHGSQEDPKQFRECSIVQFETWEVQLQIFIFFFLHLPFVLPSKSSKCFSSTFNVIYRFTFCPISGVHGPDLAQSSLLGNLCFASVVLCVNVTLVFRQYSWWLEPKHLWIWYEKYEKW